MNIYKVDFFGSLCSLVCYMIALHRLACPLRLHSYAFGIFFILSCINCIIASSKFQVPMCVIMLFHKFPMLFPHCKRFLGSNFKCSHLCESNEFDWLIGLECCLGIVYGLHGVGAEWLACSVACGSCQHYTNCGTCKWSCNWTWIVKLVCIFIHVCVQQMTIFWNKNVCTVLQWCCDPKLAL